MRNEILGLLGLTLVACGASDGESSSAASGGSQLADGGSFTVSDTLGGGFDSSSPRARARFVSGDLIELRGGNHMVRAQVSGMPDSGPGESTDFIRNNTMYSTEIEIDGQMLRVGCRPGDPIEGRFQRSAFSDSHMSGELEFVLVSCDNFVSGEPVEVPGLPMTVSASFEDLPIASP
ncbi:hypothetical protein [Wenzhouxiangella marina]|uniref:Uncharacterized protein n=1 Tax=Wenzhouxiangella marina TaxID=1579979 RepID=A0A0K0Y044_9GAMM|nr:hypothetical protein [Wenzhouxiangella marina]AKS43236.1 hypothetical protein WM2015_2879 [Wenzhouxiangella marina]MBB6087077.1 hypothetical protein [Wenzhouxiangella marina]